jgi:serine/threonine-protein kinase
MGAVWLAEHLTLNLQVAVKVIDPQVADFPNAVPRFLREARALAALRSPYIVQVSDFGSEDELVYLVMELLEGRTLGQRLKVEGKLSPAETLRVLRDVCKAMSHAHERGIIHRDLKPENIFLCDQSREHVTKVIDFGIAKPTASDARAEGNTETGAGAFLGTPSYMSPEQCRGLRQIDARTDLWALGAIAHECLTGKRLFAGELVGDLVVRICTGELPLQSTAALLPAGFEGWLRKAMAPLPEQRFGSAAELFEALTTVLDGAAAPSRSVDSAETISSLAPPAPVSSVSSNSVSPLTRVSPSSPAAGRRAAVLLAAGAIALVSALVAVLGKRVPDTAVATAPGPATAGQGSGDAGALAAPPPAQPAQPEAAAPAPPPSASQPAFQPAAVQRHAAPPRRSPKPEPPAQLDELRRRR